MPPKTLKPNQPPQCSRCHKDHWPFVRCDKADDYQKRSAAIREKRTPHMVLQPREGWRPWGDRMRDYDNLGGNLVLRKPVKRTSRVIEHPDWDREEDTDE